jgi:cell division protein ZapA
MEENVSITVLIAGRPYPLKIKASDEASIRRIVKEINDKINRFQLQYTTKDKQDCLAMATLTYAVDSQKPEPQPNPSPAQLSEDPQLIARLTNLEALLDSVLN